MSYNTELQSNNSDLQGILDTINSLPEAGSGSGSGSGGATVDDIGVFYYQSNQVKNIFVFIKGMTFGDFINSIMNVPIGEYTSSSDAFDLRYNAENGGISRNFMNTSYGAVTRVMTIDGTDSTIVGLDDVIEEREYLEYDVLGWI